METLEVRSLHASVMTGFSSRSRLHRLFPRVQSFGTDHSTLSTVRTSGRRGVGVPKPGPGPPHAPSDRRGERPRCRWPRSHGSLGSGGSEVYTDSPSRQVWGPSRGKDRPPGPTPHPPLFSLEDSGPNVSKHRIHTQGPRRVSDGKRVSHLGEERRTVRTHLSTGRSEKRQENPT